MTGPLLIAGDTHCDWGHFQYIFGRAKSFACSAIVVLGDMGYWPRHEDGARFLRKVNKESGRISIPVYFLDGNHEDHYSLALAVDVNNPIPQVLPDYPNITYLPRGATWEWGSKRFMSFGGAWSIDQDFRVLNFDYFHEELPSYSQMARALQQGEVDVLLTHDSPMSTVPFIHEELEARIRPVSQGHRKYISELVNTVRAPRLFHGHHHCRYSTLLETNHDGCAVTGLDCNGTYDKSWVLLAIE